MAPVVEPHIWGWVAIVSMVTAYVNHMTIQIYGIRLSMKRTEHENTLIYSDSYPSPSHLPVTIKYNKTTNYN